MRGNKAIVRAYLSRVWQRRVLGSMTLIAALATACSCSPNEANAHNATPSPEKPVTSIAHSDDAAIRELIDTLVKGIRAKDIGRVMSVFAPAVVSFDLGPPLEHGGGDDFLERWQELFDAYQSPIDYEVRDLSIATGDDLAFSHSLNRIGGTTKNAGKLDLWLRWTACYRKTNGKWLIVHEHVSVPVDMRNGKAMLKLTP